MKERRFVYIIRSLKYSRKHYVGLTSNIKSRLKAHNMGQSPHTTEFRPWKLHIGIEFKNQSTASRFERYLKSPSGRAFAKKHFA
jgi:predicted GIY-YIG superfamily endonuclease